MNVIYLINQYPKLSHSFIRREIRALEKLGVHVVRVSIRNAPASPDPADQVEAAATRVLLENLVGLFASVVSCLVSNPIATLRTLGISLALSRQADRGVIAHVAYFVEACRLSQIVTSESISHIHAHFGTNPPMVAMLTRHLCGVTYSFTVHGPEEFDRPIALKLGEKIEHASFVAAVSSFGRSQLMRWCPQHHWSKINVVRCGLDEQFLESERSSEYAPDTLVCVGRLCEQKGQLLLVEAMSQLQDRGVDANLILAGDGDMRGVIEERIRALGLEDRIEITGWLSGDDVKNCLLKSKTMVLPSFAEGLPVVIMEAFALSRPVITTYIAGIPELVELGNNGWIVPAGSVASLADAMVDAINASPETIHQMGRKARETVMRLHNIDENARQLQSLFHRVIVAAQQGEDVVYPMKSVCGGHREHFVESL